MAPSTRTSETPGSCCAGASPSRNAVSMRVTSACQSRLINRSMFARAIDAANGLPMKVGPCMHGPTFMGNPLAASIALANIDLLMSRDWQADVTRIETALRDGLAPAQQLPGVSDVRVLGAIRVVQLDRQVDISTATDAAVAAGLWLRPFRDLIYTMPPYICDHQDLQVVTDGVLAAVKAATA